MGTTWFFLMAGSGFVGVLAVALAVALMIGYMVLGFCIYVLPDMLPVKVEPGAEGRKKLFVGLEPGAPVGALDKWEAGEWVDRFSDENEMP